MQDTNGSAEPVLKKVRPSIPVLKLSSGYDLPMIGLGTWKSKPGDVKQAVEAAIEIGYSHIDCAAIYQNEAEVGEALAACIGSKIQRQDLFVVSKLWNNAHKKENVRTACEKSLQDLGLKYLDLYYMHWPHAFAPGGELIPKREDGTVIYDEETDPSETWAAMEELVDAGLVRSIGISNFNARQVKALSSTWRIKPVMNQVERHPYFDQHQLMEVCAAEGIAMTAYCPLGSADNPSRKADDPVLLEDKVLAEVGARHSKTAAQVALRWQIDSGVVVIPKSVNPARLKQNLDILDFKLTDADMADIKAINRDWRCNIPSVMKDGKMVPRDAAHKHYPFSDPF